MMDSLYAPGEVRRWEPSPDVPELPLCSFDMSWSAPETLECRGHYEHSPSREIKGIIIQFEGVHAFASFDGFSDILLNTREHPLPLKEPVPYGGCWPFVEIQGSRWVKDIADENIGLAAFVDVGGFTHWSVLTFDRTLHVMAPKEPRPSFKDWIR